MDPHDGIEVFGAHVPDGSVAHDARVVPRAAHVAAEVVRHDVVGSQVERVRSIDTVAGPVTFATLSCGRSMPPLPAAGCSPLLDTVRIGLKLSKVKLLPRTLHRAACKTEARAAGAGWRCAER